MRKAIAAGFAAATLLATTATPASAATVIDGFWDSTTTGGAEAQTLTDDCGSGGGTRYVDDNGFCWIDDGGSVELGVKFTTSKQVKIGGIRVYRVDSGDDMTGTLWEVTDWDGEQVTGEKLTSGTFATTSEHGWQDLVFDAPVDIAPGATYVASYYAPNADYAFEWGFFAGTALTVGPLTATASIEGDRNGVFCYGDSCGLPTESYKDTNYWVTPLLWEYDFGGYQQPIDTAVMNKAKAGSAIPIRFSLGGDEGLDILREGYPKATKIACETSAPTDTIEETVTSGFSTLKYDSATDQYTYIWKTAKTTMANNCYKFELGLDDWSSQTFKVSFVK